MMGNLDYWPVRGKDTLVCSRCGNQIHPPIGRPDILVLSPKGRSCVVEVKVVNMKREKAFALDSISPEQRRWLTSWFEAGGKGYLALGTVNIRPRRLWLIPWHEWLSAEKRAASMEKKSIPIDLQTYSRLPSVRHDVAGWFEEHELEWCEGSWMLRLDHELRRNVDVT
jgi:hypothetical protein